MGIYNLRVATNHPGNKYIPGQRVIGRVSFKVDSPKTVRGIYLKMKGKAEVSWTETRSLGKSASTVTYLAKEKYFSDRYYFRGEKDGESFEVEPGEYCYKFAYDLPMNLPVSYEGNYGKVIYTAELIFDIPWGFDDSEKVKLDIFTPFNLNTRPQLKEPENDISTKSICCMCCKSGPLTMEFHVPKTGYCHGETIEIKGDIENLTNSVVSQVKCKLKRVVTYHSEKPSHKIKEDKTDLAEVVLEGVFPWRTRTYDLFELKIPDGELINFGICKIIVVEYYLKFKAYFEGCHKNLCGKILLTMGNVPFIQDGMLEPPKDILHGLGTPYPSETQPERIFNIRGNQNQSNSSDEDDFGCAACVKVCA